MKPQTHATILSYIRQHPGVTYSELYHGLLWTRPTIERYVRAMVKTGEVRRQVLKERRGRHGFWASGMIFVTWLR